MELVSSIRVVFSLLGPSRKPAPPAQAPGGQNKRH